MKGWHMYTDIQSQRNLGFSKRQVAEHLGLDFRTISRYWDMDPDTFQKVIQNRQRRRNLELYEGVITDWLKRFPGLTASQVLDWLEQHYQAKVADRTVRRFVSMVRKKHNIPKTRERTRQYMAVEDPPMGHQMQVDFGSVYVVDMVERRHRKLYCLATVLSHSRYKWGKWFTSPPTTQQLVSALEDCFEFMGGMPAELVFDQDRLVAVDENYGDIIYTQEFEKFRQIMGFTVYLCRGADPESKGRVEAVVKYYKNHFAKYRQFSSSDLWEDEFLSWLARTGNARIHGTTKKIPAEVFQQEKLFLKPVPQTKRIITPIVTRLVHKDNTVFYKGCRYSLPLGTYTPGLEVILEEENGRLRIETAIDHELIAEHPLSTEKGRLIRNNNHVRDYSQSLNNIQQALCEKLASTERAQTFLEHIRILKGRYVRDQFQAIEKAIEGLEDKSTIEKALTYCVEHSLYSAADFRNAIAFFVKAKKDELEAIAANPKVTMLPKVRIQKRSLEEYTALLEGGDK